LDKNVPIDEKFYLGGINTLRGYNGRTVCPVIKNSIFSSTINGEGSLSDIYAFLGGDTEAYFNAEYQFHIIKEAGLKGVLFIDVGNAYDGLNKMFSRFQLSYGFGFRWFSPMGPLRLEYGIPFNPRAGIDKSGGRIEFSMGSFF
jgi:outer membrane protein insertion porin family